MREIRKLVFGGERFRRAGQRLGGVAVVAGHRAGRRCARLVVGHQVCGRSFESCRVVPLDLERVARLLRGPERCREYRDPGGQLDDVADARKLLRFVGIELRHLGAEARRMRDHGGEHARKLHVLRELGGAVRFCARIGARHALADIDEILRVLQVHRGRNRLHRGIGGQLAERRLPARRVREHALLDRDRFGGNIPALRRRADEHRAHGGTRLAQLLEGVGHCRRAAGPLDRPHQQIVVEFGIGGRTLDPDLRPGGVHLLGHQGRQSGVSALTHLEVLDQHRDRVVAADTDERVRLPRPGGRGARAALARARHLSEGLARQIETEGEAGGRAGGRFQETAPSGGRRS